MSTGVGCYALLNDAQPQDLLVVSLDILPKRKRKSGEYMRVHIALFFTRCLITSGSATCGTWLFLASAVATSVHHLHMLRHRLHTNTTTFQTHTTPFASIFRDFDCSKCPLYFSHEGEPALSFYETCSEVASWQKTGLAPKQDPRTLCASVDDRDEDIML